MSSIATLGREASSPVRYDASIEDAVGQVAGALSAAYGFAPRAVALLLLEGDPDMADRVRAAEGSSAAGVLALVDEVRAGSRSPLDTSITLQRHHAARAIARSVTLTAGAARAGWSERLSRLTTEPLTGIPILALIVWLALYQFVGVFGGGTLVGLLEERLFGRLVNPWVTAHVRHWLPWPWLSSLVVGDYGIWTLGVTYAVALIFPIVGTFFIAFSVLEDSGYLPRLAMLIDRLFKRIGLNGKAVIPIVLGLGCDTMATIVTRILETRRERVIATFLLALAIPCSAQIGVMTALLAGHPLAFGLWAGIMAVVFVVVGYLTAKLLPGEPARFALELPPLRLPSLSNIAVKTYARMQWYFMEVLPLFVLASVAIWIGQLTGLFGLTVRALEPVAAVLGLPTRTAEAFLFGFFRRDYGAAGLYRMQESGALTGNQLLVSVVTLTIFLPCVAQFLMMKKERGLKMTLAMSAFIFPFAIVVGATLNLVLTALHAHL